ncbi:MAG TPA: DnaJ C-terminal domain-containing protein, partial [Reyranella sp.]|nr:DnaJ C-terminal domain-containing protein [Reyranella sp.]
ALNRLHMMLLREYGNMRGLQNHRALNARLARQGRIPAGSNTGTSLRLKGRGLLDRKSKQRGDQYVKLKVVLPDKPDPALKEFLEKWEAGRAYDPRKAMEQFT